MKYSEEKSVFGEVSYQYLFKFSEWEGEGGGHLSTFSAFRMGAYSRWVLIQGWALIQINTVAGDVVLSVVVSHGGGKCYRPA